MNSQWLYPGSLKRLSPDAGVLASAGSIEALLAAFENECPSVHSRRPVQPVQPVLDELQPPSCRLIPILIFRVEAAGYGG